MDHSHVYSLLSIKLNEKKKTKTNKQTNKQTKEKESVFMTASESQPATISMAGAA